MQLIFIKTQAVSVMALWDMYELSISLDKSRNYCCPTKLLQDFSFYMKSRFIGTFPNIE
jgi:hypothetical protein